MSAFRVGQKVCVVDVRPLDKSDDPVLFSLREIVTVSRICPDGCLALVEYPQTGRVIAYHDNRFRPVTYPQQSAEHDAELFQPWLNPDPIDVCDIYERDFAETNARLSALWQAMGRFEL